MNSHTQRGFTLYELLVTVLVLGVVLGLGVPNLLEFSRNNRMAATANDLVSAIHLARNEAVMRRVPITLCMSPEPIDDNPVCDPDFSDPDSGGGFIVWVDADDDGVVDVGEEILLQRDDPQDVTIIPDSGGTTSGYIRFGANGFVQNIPSEGPAATLIRLCDTRGNAVVSGSLSAARALRIPPTGRPSLLIEVAELATVGDCS